MMHQGIELSYFLVRLNEYSKEYVEFCEFSEFYYVDFQDCLEDENDFNYIKSLLKLLKEVRSENIEFIYCYKEGIYLINVEEERDRVLEIISKIEANNIMKNIVENDNGKTKRRL